MIIGFTIYGYQKPTGWKMRIKNEELRIERPLWVTTPMARPYPYRAGRINNDGF